MNTSPSALSSLQGLRSGAQIFLSLTLCASASLFTGCGSSAQTCTDLKEAYTQAQRQQSGQFKADAIVAGTQLHERTLQRALEEAIRAEGGLPSQAIHRNLPGGARLSINLTWRKVSASLTDSCDNCLNLSADVDAVANITFGGQKLFADRATGRLVGALPLTLSTSSQGSSLKADLKQTKLSSFKLRLNKVPRQFSRLTDGYLKEAAQATLQRLGQPTTLATWRPLAIPDTTLKLTAQTLHVFPAQKTVWIGWRSETPISNSSLSPKATLGPEDEAALTLTGSALTAIMRNLQREGKLPDRLNRDLKPDPDGDVWIDLDALTPTPEGLKTTFSAWHLPEEGTCYRADLAALASVDLVEVNTSGRVGLTMTEIDLISSEGDDTLFRLGLWLRSAFVAETLSAQTEFLTSSRFRAGAGREITAEYTRVETDLEGVSLYLNPKLGNPKLGNPKLKKSSLKLPGVMKPRSGSLLRTPPPKVWKP